MGNAETEWERNAQLAARAELAQDLAREAEEEGCHARAAIYLAEAVFLRDCMSTRLTRFRGRATLPPGRR